MSGHHHHDHGHGDHCHAHGEDGHDHSNDITPALQSLLYSQIQFDTILTLNGMVMSIERQRIPLISFLCSESAPRSGAAIVQKTWAERLNEHPELESDADEQLLMSVPYVINSLNYVSLSITRPCKILFERLNTPPYPASTLIS